jgi:hypothetical protein
VASPLKTLPEVDDYCGNITTTKKGHDVHRDIKGKKKMRFSLSLEQGITWILFYF